MAASTQRNLALALFVAVAIQTGNARRNDAEAIGKLIAEESTETRQFLQCEQLCYTSSEQEDDCHYKMSGVLSHSLMTFLAWNDNTTDMGQAAKDLFFNGEPRENLIWFCAGGLCDPPENPPGYCKTAEADEDDMAEIDALVKGKGRVTRPINPLTAPWWQSGGKNNDGNDALDAPRGEHEEDENAEAVTPSTSGDVKEDENAEAVTPSTSGDVKKIDIIGAVVAAEDGTDMVIAKAKIGEKGKFIANLGEDGTGKQIEVDIKDVKVDHQKSLNLKKKTNELVATVVLDCGKHTRGTSERDACCVFSKEGCKGRVSHLGRRVLASCVKSCVHYE